MATTRSTLTLFLTLCCLCNLTNARIHLAPRVPQPLDARSSSAGGWVLVNPTCPSGSTACPSVEGSNAATCCPNNLTCQYDLSYDQHYCCPSGSNCQSTIQGVPVCADPGWNLYSQSSTQGGFFCCLPGQVGILSDGMAIGSCNDAGLAYASSVLASSVTQLGQAVATVSVATNTLSSGIATTKGESTAASSGTATSQPSTSSTSQPSLLNVRLGTGAIAGIGVGAVVFFVVASSGVWACLRKRNRIQQVATNYYSKPPVQAYQNPAAYTQSQGVGYTRSEVSNYPMSELGVQSRN